MPARDVVLERERQALIKVRDIIERHSPETAAQLRLLSSGGALPNSVKSPELLNTFLAEAVVVLAERVDALKAANQPRRRGRPKGS